MSNARGAGRPWAAAVLARRTLADFAAAWRALPEWERRRFVHVLAAGWTAAALLMLGMVWIVRALGEAGRLGWEAEFLQWFGGPGSPVQFSTGMWIETPGNSIVVVPLALFAAGWAARHGRSLRALAFAVSIPAYKLLVGVGWFVWRRPRPDLVEHGLGAPDGWSSFPSGHVTQSLAVYGLLIYLWMRHTERWSERLAAGAVLALLVFCSGAGRLRTGAHWPTDLLAGLVGGAAWLGTVIYALRTSPSER